MSTAIRDWEKAFGERFVFEQDNGPASAYMLFLRLPDSLKIATVDDVKAFIKEVMPTCYLTEEDDPAEHDLRKYSAACGQCYSALAEQDRWKDKEISRLSGEVQRLREAGEAAKELAELLRKRQIAEDRHWSAEAMEYTVQINAILAQLTAALRVP